MKEEEKGKKKQMIKIENYYRCDSAYREGESERKGKDTRGRREEGRRKKSKIKISIWERKV